MNKQACASKRNGFRTQERIGLISNPGSIGNFK
jgi:hypothetical protein